MIKFFKNIIKYNWVSDKGQFIGFDADQCCCEYFGYSYVNKKFKKLSDVLDDSNYNKELERLIVTDGINNDLIFGKIIKNYFTDKSDDVENFVLVEILDNAGNGLEGYLVLYNCHNGYYYHGLEYCLKPKLNSISL